MLVHLWLEGAHHPFEELADWYTRFLVEQGHEVRAGTLGELLEQPAPDLYALGGLTFSGHPETYRPIGDDGFAKLRANLAQGTRLLGLHCVLGSFDENGEEVGDLFDGQWLWDRSEHSPVEEFEAKVTKQIPLTEGVPERFRIKDELYYNLRNPERSEVFLEAEYKGQPWPLAWHGVTEGSPMVYLGLGHDLDSVSNAGFQSLLANALRHLGGK